MSNPEKPEYVALWEWATGEVALQNACDATEWFYKTKDHQDGSIEVRHIPDLTHDTAENERTLREGIERWCDKQRTGRQYGCLYTAYRWKPDGVKEHSAYVAIRDKKFECMESIPVKINDDGDYADVRGLSTKHAALLALARELMKLKENPND